MVTWSRVTRPGLGLGRADWLAVVCPSRGRLVVMLPIGCLFLIVSFILGFSHARPWRGPACCSRLAENPWRSADRSLVAFGPSRSFKPSLPLQFVADELGFDSVLDCAAFARRCGLVLDEKAEAEPDCGLGGDAGSGGASGVVYSLNCAKSSFRAPIKSKEEASSLL